MLPLFKSYLGSPLGDGGQWFSWIHMDDLLGALFFLLQQPDAAGPYNLTAPGAVRNRELAKGLGRALHRPSLIPAPALALRLVLGEFGSVILEGQKVVPARLLEAGYSFRHGELDSALAAVFGGR